MGALVRFRGPGDYLAESYCYPEGERGEVQIEPCASLHGAIESARVRAHSAALVMETGRVSRALGRDVSPEVAALMAKPVRDWRELRDALNREAGRQAVKGSIVVGVDEAGPSTPMEELSADEFTRRYGIVDDLVTTQPTRETIEKMQELLAARHRDARDRLFSAYQAGDEARSRMEWPAELVSFDDVIKAARKWLSECDPAATGVLLHIGVDPETATTDPRFLAGLAAGEIQHRGDRDWFVSRAFVLREAVDTLTPVMIRRAVAVLEENAIPKGPDGMYRLPSLGPELSPTRLGGLDKVTIEPVRGFPLPPRREEDFERGQRMAMNTPIDRAMVTGPVDFKRAGERSRLQHRRYEPTPPVLEGTLRINARALAGSVCTCGGDGSGTCSWCVAGRRRQAGRRSWPAGGSARPGSSTTAPTRTAIT